MKLFEWFGRKKNKEKELDAAFARLAGELRQVESRDDHKKRQRKIIESCEQIIETTKELEELRAERRVIDTYLDDINKIETLPEKEHKELLDVAGSIVRLDKSKKAYLSSERKIDDTRFAFFQERQDDIVPDLKKLQSNETYQRTLKKDMAYLEGEKSQWVILKEDIKKEQSTLKKLLVLLFACSVVVASVFLVIGNLYYLDMKLAWLILLFFDAIVCFAIYMRLQMDEKDLRQSEVNLNYAIELLNKTKIKYVSITNALDYSYEKYNVGSSADLNYQWEQYVSTVREDEKFARDNEDYEFYTARLVRLLSKMGLNDQKIWISQVKAIINEDEMGHVKSELLSRGQKIDDNIEYSISLIRNERVQIDKMMKNEREYLPEIQEIIKSVDKLCEVKL